jgi:hypothetical protein
VGPYISPLPRYEREATEVIGDLLRYRIVMLETANEQWKLGARDDVYCVARSGTVQYQGAKRLIYH